MLKNTLYTVGNIQEKGNHEYTIEVNLNEHHQIFEGHFPGHPVLPGVCLTEILKDLINEVTKGSFRMHEASMIKYLQMVNPLESKTLVFSFSLSSADGGLKVSASSTLSDDVTNFKFKGSFIPVKE